MLQRLHSTEKIVKNSFCYIVFILQSLLDMELRASLPFLSMFCPCVIFSTGRQPALHVDTTSKAQFSMPKLYLCAQDRQNWPRFGCPEWISHLMRLSPRSIPVDMPGINIKFSCAPVSLVFFSKSFLCTVSRPSFF